MARRALSRKPHNVRRRVKHERRQCTVCGRRFIPRRSDAVTCSGACRQLAYRMRQAT